MQPEPERYRWKRLLPYLAPAVLIVVGLTQMAMAHLTHLTPWKGGGFGMFSAIDGRAVHVLVIRPDGEERLAIRRLGRVAGHARNYPTEATLQIVADMIAERGGDKLTDATALRVEVWQTRFESDTTTLTEELVLSVTHELPDPER